MSKKKDFLREDECGCKIKIVDNIVKLKTCEKHTWNLEDWLE